MKKIVFMLMVICFCTGNALAEMSPKKIVETMTSQMKKTGNVVHILDYVYWPKAYESLSVRDRTQMGITDPQQMKTRMQQLFNDPSAIMAQGLQNQLSGLTPEQKTMMEAQMKQVSAMMQSKRKEMSDKLKQTSFQVGSEKIDGNRATVPVTSVYQGETEKKDIQFEKIEGKWYLPTIDFAESSQG